MANKQEIIIRYFRDNQTQRKISRELGVGRKTVRGYIREYEKAKTKLEKQNGKPLEGFIEALVGSPHYDTSKRIKRRLTTEIAEQIDAYLEKNRKKRSEGLGKQQMKKIDIMEALHEQGHQIGYTTICNYIVDKEQRRREAYIRQAYEPGQVCEFDWAEVKLNIAGQRRICQLATFTAANSNYRWACLFYRQDTLSFQQAHADFFAHLDGVYYEMVYDNMRVVIRRFVGLTEKEPTEGLLGLSMYYQFGFRFCNVRRGNEKGHVERSVEYIRRKAFARRDSFDSLEQANEYLLEVCRDLNRRTQIGKGKSAEELLAGERPYLTACPVVPFECAVWQSLRVDKYSTVSLGTNHYSAPEVLVGRMVDVKVYPSRLVMYYQKEQVCQHERRFTPHGWYIHLAHYLTTLERKPGALAGSVALQQADAGLRRIYESYFQDRSREFIQLLHYRRDKQLSVDKVETTIRELHKLSLRDISLDKIKVLCEQSCSAQPPKGGDQTNGAIEQASKVQLAEVAKLLNPLDMQLSNGLNPIVQPQNNAS